MRQRIRNFIVLISLLAFPLTLNYFSPYLSMSGAREGIVSGSLALFGLLLVSSLILGRAFCGWICPGGCLQDFCQRINNKRRPRHHWIKFLVWGPWFGMVVFLAVKAGGFHKVALLYMMEKGISVSEPANFYMYYTVLILFLVLAVALGRHAFCHYACWMAPFLMIGRKARNIVHWPALQLRARTENCTNCLTCTQVCPMSIDVNAEVQAGDMEHSDCILCGQCADNCPSRVIGYSFGLSGKKSRRSR